MDSYPYKGYYVKDSGGIFIDSLKKEDIDILLLYGMIISTSNPFKYLVHKNYWLDDIMDELEQNGITFAIDLD